MENEKVIEQIVFQALEIFWDNLLAFTTPEEGETLIKILIEAAPKNEEQLRNMIEEEEEFRLEENSSVPRNVIEAVYRYTMQKAKELRGDGNE